MPTRRRSIIGRSLFLLAGCIVSLSTSPTQVVGRKCVCTSKACKEAGVDTCRTRFFCYTELIMTTGREIGESTTTRGCTEGATPLLCETKSWVTRSRSVNTVELSSANSRILVPWPRLKCCNSHDYCNTDDDDENDDENVSTWTRERKIQMDQTHSANRGTLMDSPMSTNRDTKLTLQPDRKYEDSTESADQFLRNRIKALHIAALVLAVAALISVLASCYVVTRFVSYYLSSFLFFGCSTALRLGVVCRDALKAAFLSVYLSTRGPEPSVSKTVDSMRLGGFSLEACLLIFVLRMVKWVFEFENVSVRPTSYTP